MNVRTETFEIAHHPAIDDKQRLSIDLSLVYGEFNNGSFVSEGNDPRKMRPATQVGKDIYEG